MPARSLATLGPLIALLLLGACATHPPRATAPGSAAAFPAGHGVYKVGNPYQINGVWYYPAEDWSYDETGIASWYGADFHGKYTANGEVFDLNAITAAHRTLPMPCVVEVTNLENGRTLKVKVNDRGPYARGRIIDLSRRSAQLLGFESPGTARVRVKILISESIQVASLARRNDPTEIAADPARAAPLERVSAEPLAPPPGVRVAAASSQMRLPAPPPPPAPPPAIPAAIEPPPLSDKVVTVPVRATNIFIQAGAFSRTDNALRLKQKLDTLGPVKVTGAHVNGMELYRVRLGPVGSVDEADRLLSRVIEVGANDARIVVD
jgi:rare lipoprotein A